MPTEDRLNELARVANQFGEELDAQNAAEVAAYLRDGKQHRSPPRLIPPLEAPHGISTGAEAYMWFQGAIEGLHASAEVIPHDPRNRWGHQGDRAICPLCGEGAIGNLNQLEPGYAYPEGLWRHLMGESNSRMCRVARGMFEEAHSRWRKS